MSTGLQRATLATIETGEWHVRGYILSGAKVVRLYEACPDVQAMCDAVGARVRSDRFFDRAVKILKRAGLIEYRNGAWHRKGEG